MNKSTHIHPYLIKIFTDQKWALFSLIFLTALFEYFYAWFVLRSGINQFMQAYINIMPSMFKTWLGIEGGGATEFNTQLLAFGFAHPFILIIMSLLPVGISTRYIAGEIENRTFDIFLTKPVRRCIVPVVLFTFLLGSILVQSLAMISGSILAYYQYDVVINLQTYLHIFVAAFTFYLSMATIAMAISAFHSEKGKALMSIMGLLIVFYSYDSIIRATETAAYLKKFSYFQLYQPTDLVKGVQNIWTVIGISVIITTTGFLTAYHRFKSRDL